jgi:hypothetical protein
VRKHIGSSNSNKDFDLLALPSPIVFALREVLILAASHVPVSCFGVSVSNLKMGTVTYIAAGNGDRISQVPVPILDRISQVPVLILETGTQLQELGWDTAATVFETNLGKLVDYILETRALGWDT